MPSEFEAKGNVNAAEHALLITRAEEIHVKPAAPAAHDCTRDRDQVSEVYERAADCSRKLPFAGTCVSSKDRVQHRHTTIVRKRQQAEVTPAPISIQTNISSSTSTYTDGHADATTRTVASLRQRMHMLQLSLPQPKFMDLRVDSWLGSGGSASVYLVHDPDNHYKQFALKVRNTV